MSPPFSSCRVSYLNLVGLISKRGVIRVLAGLLGGLNESLCGKHLAQCLASSRHCINYLFAGMSLMAQGLGSIPGQGSSTHHVVRLPPPPKKHLLLLLLTVLLAAKGKPTETIFWLNSPKARSSPGPWGSGCVLSGGDTPEERDGLSSSLFSPPPTA